MRTKILETCIQASITKKSYQLRSNIAKHEKGSLVAESYSILARWENHFTHILNAHGINDVRQTAIQTAEPLVPFRFR